MKKALTIAGSDCSGGAGVQADLKTFAAHGVYGMSAVTSVVAENTLRVIGREDLSPGLIGGQLDAVFEDMGADAVKIGMLPGVPCMRAVAERLRAYRPPRVVIDPVMMASSGGPLMEPDAMGTFLAEILPLADLITPNLPEAEAMAGFAVRTPEEMERAARAIVRLGARAVLVKGGHLPGDALDILCDGAAFHSFSAGRVPARNIHGTGCTLSSAIAANLALGFPLPQAVRRAKAYLTAAIRHSLPMGKGAGLVQHFYDFYPNGNPKGDKTDAL